MRRASACDVRFLQPARRQDFLKPRPIERPIAIIQVEDKHEGVMKGSTWLRHDSQMRSNDVCTQNSDTFDANPGTKIVDQVAHRSFVASCRQLVARMIVVQMSKSTATM